MLGGSLFAFIFVGTLYMQQVLHYSALQTGVAWLAASLTSVAPAGVSRWLVTQGGAKIVMAVGMTLIGAGVLWATQVPVHGHFVANLLGPLMVAGAGTAFALIAISIAALAGVAEHRAGLASGPLNTREQVGGAIGIAVASSVAAGHTQALLHAGGHAPAALTGGLRQALSVLGDRAARGLRDLRPGAPQRALRRRCPDGGRGAAARARRSELAHINPTTTFTTKETRRCPPQQSQGKRYW
jgi:hypothetical protein